MISADSVSSFSSFAVLATDTQSFVFSNPTNDDLRALNPNPANILYSLVSHHEQRNPLYLSVILGLELARAFRTEPFR